MLLLQTHNIVSLRWEVKGPALSQLCWAIYARTTSTGLISRCFYRFLPLPLPFQASLCQHTTRYPRSSLTKSIFSLQFLLRRKPYVYKLENKSTLNHFFSFCSSLLTQFFLNPLVALLLIFRIRALCLRTSLLGNQTQKLTRPLIYKWRVIKMAA